MAILLDAILLDKGLVDGDRVALLINGLGGTPPMELDIVARAALSQLRAKGLVVERAWSGNFVTSLEIPGCSLSLLTLDDARIAQLDAPARAPAWPGSGHVGLTGNRVASPEAPVDTRATPTPGPLSGALKKAVLAVAASVTGAETGLAQLDAEAGDGDLGASMARGAEAMRDLPDAAFASPEILLEALGHALRRAIAGSSGPFYATALMRAGRALGGLDVPDANAWANAFSEAVSAVSEISGSRPGERTMIDALRPAETALRHAVGQPRAWAGAEKTCTMTAKLGRASYLGDRVEGIPDRAP